MHSCLFEQYVTSVEAPALLPRPRSMNHPPTRPMLGTPAQLPPSVQRPTQSHARKSSNAVVRSMTHGKPMSKPVSQQGQSESNPLKLTASTVRIEHMPAFAMKNQKWRLSFLPTFHCRFYSSKQPFDEFLLGSDALVNIVQEIVDAVYIDVSYTVKCKGEPFHLMVSVRHFVMQHDPDC